MEYAMGVEYREKEIEAVHDVVYLRCAYLCK
jgi:hypothetical protein